MGEDNNSSKNREFSRNKNRHIFRCALWGQRRFFFFSERFFGDGVFRTCAPSSGSSNSNKGRTAYPHREELALGDLFCIDQCTGLSALEFVLGGIKTAGAQLFGGVDYDNLVAVAEIVLVRVIAPTLCGGSKNFVLIIVFFVFRFRRRLSTNTVGSRRATQSRNFRYVFVLLLYPEHRHLRLTRDTGSEY